MPQWYLNAGASTQNGLTPETGYHNLELLNLNEDLIFGDFVDFVDNGEITEHPTDTLFIMCSLNLRSWSENTGVPVWKIPEYDTWNEGSVIFNNFSSSAIVNIFGIKIVNTGLFSRLCIQGTMSSLIERCYFDGVGLSAQYNTREFNEEPVDLIVKNNIFANLILTENVGCIESHAYTGTNNLKIINNTFYKGSSGVSMFENVKGKIIGNIFLDQGNVCAYIGDGYAVDILLDHNLTYGWEGPSDFYNINPVYVGEHNKRNIDPLLADPEAGNFNPEGESQCFAGTIGNSVDEDVPVIDYDGADRTLDMTTTGALNGSSSSPSPTFLLTQLLPMTISSNVMPGNPAVA